MATILTFLKALLSFASGLFELYRHEQAKQSGRNEVRLANATEALEQVQAARGIEREMASADLSDLAQRMREFQRD
jgi:hypothetical protein